MRIVFMGTPDFAVPCLEKLIADGHEVAAVFTQPDKPKGRGYKLTAPPVKVRAEQNGIPIYQPESMKEQKTFADLQALSPEIIVVVAYGKLLPIEILELPPYGCVNVHGSILPKYRGAAPIQWSVLNGDEIAGVTTMYMAQGLDSGDIILTHSTPIGENETSGELYTRLAIIGAKALGETLEIISERNAQRTPQAEHLATVAPMLTKELAKIDFTKSAKEVHHLICGMNPWPIAHTLYDGQIIKLYRSRVAEGSGAPGELIDTKRFIVACGNGAIEVLEIQLQGGKRMAAVDYLRGHPAKENIRLG